jgi:chaperonin GroEL
MIIENKPLEKIQIGVDKLADVVRETLGPKGKNILIDQGKSKLMSTRDGVTVAHHIILDDRLENMGASIIRHAAKDTNSEAGDGTSSCTILAQAIFKEGLKYLAAGHSPIEIKRSVDKALAGVLDSLKGITKKTENIEHIATISANNDPVLGKMIAEGIHKVGKDGTILVEHSTKPMTHVTFQEGMVVERGWDETSIYFINNIAKRRVEYDNPEIIIIDQRIERFAQIENVIRHVAKNQKPLIMLVRDIEDSVLACIVANKVEKGVPIAVIKTPGFNSPELINDIACRSGARLYNSDWSTLDSFKPEDLGGAEKVIIGKSDTTIIQGRGDISKRLAELNEQIQSEEDRVTKVRLQDRLNRLTSCVATINVFANSEAELTDLKLRIEDAINATKHALAEGIVQGGGTALLKIRPEGDSVGELILKKAMETPFWYIIENAGKNPYAILNSIENSEGYAGYDANKEEFVEDLFKAGIMDPVKVTRTALEKATSAATMLLLTGSCLIKEEKKK